jgi:hypothetical protein
MGTTGETRSKRRRGVADGRIWSERRAMRAARGRSTASLVALLAVTMAGMRSDRVRAAIGCGAAQSLHGPTRAPQRSPSGSALRSMSGTQVSRPRPGVHQRWLLSDSRSRARQGSDQPRVAIAEDQSRGRTALLSQQLQRWGRARRGQWWPDRHRPRLPGSARIGARLCSLKPSPSVESRSHAHTGSTLRRQSLRRSSFSTRACWSSSARTAPRQFSRGALTRAANVSLGRMTGDSRRRSMAKSCSNTSEGWRRPASWRAAGQKRAAVRKPRSPCRGRSSAEAGAQSR